MKLPPPGTGLLLILLALLLAACTPPVTVPMVTAGFTNSRGVKQHETLLVFLPGIHDETATFVKEGFIAAAQTQGVSADMMGAEAHIGYFKKRQFLKRFRQDVILPAKARGYRKIWLVGVSLGGFGAIWYDLEHPGELAGIVALAPYLGEPDVVEEVAAAGGLAAWQPSADPAGDPQREIWSNLKRYERSGLTRGRVYLGYGREDKFAGADGMLAAVLLSDQVFTMAGGHDWKTWRQLWDVILRTLPLEFPLIPDPVSPREPGG